MIPTSGVHFACEDSCSASHPATRGYVTCALPGWRRACQNNLGTPSDIRDAARGVTHQTGREFTARISQWPKALPLSVWGNARLRAPPANPINRSIRITVKCPIMAEPGSGIRQSARLTHFDYFKIQTKGTGFACVVLSLDPIFKNSEYDCILLFS